MAGAMTQRTEAISHQEEPGPETNHSAQSLLVSPTSTASTPLASLLAGSAQSHQAPSAASNAWSLPSQQAPSAAADSAPLAKPRIKWPESTKRVAAVRQGHRPPAENYGHYHSEHCSQCSEPPNTENPASKGRSEVTEVALQEDRSSREGQTRRPSGNPREGAPDPSESGEPQKEAEREGKKEWHF